MRIRVEEVRARGDGPTEVTFSTAIGTGAGVWADRKHAPTVGRAYDVELTVDVPLVEHTTLFFSIERRASITQDGAQVVLNGEIELVHEDGVAELRLADDCLTTIDSEDVELQEGRWVRLMCPPASLLVFAHDAY